MSKFPSLSPENWPFSLDWLPESAKLVGGAVRDALLQREGEYLDLDFVLPTSAVTTAQKIAGHYQAGFVLLDKERQIARVVFPQATVDFAQQEGESLAADLQRRDFTVNAIAYNPHREKLFDPLQGIEDLKLGVMRMVAKGNLEDDPLRLLRAYRQAAQLNFTIDSLTRSTIASLAGKLSTVAAERVRTEIGYLLASSGGNQWLEAAHGDGLFQYWLVNVTAEKLEKIRKIEESARIITNGWPELREDYSSGLSIAKLTALVSASVGDAELELLKLKYSRSEIRTVTTVLNILKILPKLQNHWLPLSLREQYFLFKDAGAVFPIIAVLAMAYGVNIEAIAPLINRYLEPNDAIAHPQPLVTGKDIMNNLNLPPSRTIGKLLTEIQLAAIEGKIATREEAFVFAASLL